MLFEKFRLNPLSVFVIFIFFRAWVFPFHLLEIPRNHDIVNPAYFILVGYMLESVEVMLLVALVMSVKQCK